MNRDESPEWKRVFALAEAAMSVSTGDRVGDIDVVARAILDAENAAVAAKTATLRAAAIEAAKWVWMVCDQTLACPCCGVAWWNTDGAIPDDWHVPGCELYALMVTIGMGTGKRVQQGEQAYDGMRRLDSCAREPVREEMIAELTPILQEILERDDEPAIVASDDEELGRLVRDTWIVWAREQPNPKPSWLVPWEGLGEPDRDVDRRIGAAIRDHVLRGVK